ncbi:MAG: hypothetical protein V4710_06740 [Verrucomicrobiota bacterium]
MSKKTIVFSFTIGLVTWLLWQALQKPINKLSPPVGSGDHQPTHPTSSVAREEGVASRENSVPPESRDGAANNLLPQLEAALKTVDAADPRPFRVLLAKLVRADPMAAARFAEAIPAGFAREETLRRVAQYWAAQDPVKTEIWAAELPDKNESRLTLVDVCLQISQANPCRAVQMAEQHDLGTMPGEILENLVQQWAAQDFSRAAAWIRERPTSEQRDEMVRRLALVQAQTDPAKAATLVVEEIASGQIQDEAAVSVVHQWAARDLSGASAWIDLFPSGKLRERAKAELLNIANRATEERP